MAKSDSTRKPKLPHFWIELTSSGRAADILESRPEKVEAALYTRYAPAQKPRRCVWTKHGQTRTETSCGLSLWDDPAFLCCYNCGGKIVRRKS